MTLENQIEELQQKRDKALMKFMIANKEHQDQTIIENHRLEYLKLNERIYNTLYKQESSTLRQIYRLLE